MILLFVIGIIFTSAVVLAQWEPRPERIRPHDARINSNRDNYRQDMRIAPDRTQQERIDRAREKERQRERDYHFSNPYDFRWINEGR